MNNAENKVYHTLKSGTVIDDNYINKSLAKLEKSIADKSIKKVYERPQPKKITFDSLPAELREELRPFIVFPKPSKIQHSV